MASALYHPTLGYYARKDRKVGRNGDFFTSVSVGPLFGQLLARRFLRHWRKSKRPARWRVIETGAHDATLAADLLDEIARLDSAAASSLDYVICEPLPALRAAQRETLARFPKARVVESPEPLAKQPLPGIAFGNELLDALPFHLVERHQNVWHERRVTIDSNHSLAWEARPLQNPGLIAALEPLGNRFPDGYQTEVRTGIEQFLAPLARALDAGLMLWIDYGFARPDYYHPDRRHGTLRTFSRHRSADDPLESPGEFDITAHVDFTAAARAAATLGGRPTDFQNQGSWLTKLAGDWLLTLEGRPDPALLRQFQTLTHPAQLGSRFHMLELSWDDTTPAAPRLDHRLFGHSE